jgi:hypothetical protein
MNTFVTNDADHAIPVSVSGVTIDSGGLATSSKQDTQTTAIAATQPRSDAGPSWTTSSGIAGVRFTSADQSAAAVVTSAPTSGQKLVITDLIVSVDTAMRVDFSVESAASTIIESIYLAANVPVNLITRGKRKLGTADKKLAVRTSAAGNICVNAFYYSEA